MQRALASWFIYFEALAACLSILNLFTSVPWPRFLLFNALGGIAWATLYAVGGYFLGENVHRLAGPLGTTLLVLAVLVIAGALLFLRQNERRLEDEAERALPGPLDEYQPGGVRGKRPV